MRILGAEHGDNGDDGYNGGDGKMGVMEGEDGNWNWG